MANTHFDFKQFRIEQDCCAMKVTSDSCVFGGWAVERLQSMPQSPKRILDIGTGTGLLTLMIAQAIEDTTIDAIEIDPDAAYQARQNIDRSPWKDRILVHQGDVLGLSTDIKYDFILTNPPFYEDELTGPDIRKNQAHHDAGLPFSKLIDCIIDLLLPTGQYFLLLPSKGIDQRISRMRAMGLKDHRRVDFQHSPKHPISRIFLEGGFDSGLEAHQESIFLQDPEGGYSDRIRTLLHPYYLAF